jgi:hypothetical protein
MEVLAALTVEIRHYDRLIRQSTEAEYFEMIDTDQGTRRRSPHGIGRTFQCVNDSRNQIFPPL